MSTRISLSTITFSISMGILIVVFALPSHANTQHTCKGEIATIVGTEGDDVLRGTRGRDVIVGLGGDDVIRGKRGDDLICAGVGNDTIHGSRGKDQIYGEDGDDTIYGGRGADMIYGGAGNDTIRGKRGADTVYGEGGADTLIGSRGPDLLVGGPGHDTVDGRRGSDVCYGESLTRCEEEHPDEGGDRTPPVITLLGDNPLILTVGDSFTDPGATAEDETDGDVTQSITVGGDTVDVDTVGVYVITYDVTDAAGNAAQQVTRAVHIEADDGIDLALSMTESALLPGETKEITFMALVYGVEGQAIESVAVHNDRDATVLSLEPGVIDATSFSLTTAHTAAETPGVCTTYTAVVTIGGRASVSPPQQICISQYGKGSPSTEDLDLDNGFTVPERDYTVSTRYIEIFFAEGVTDARIGEIAAQYEGEIVSGFHGVDTFYLRLDRAPASLAALAETAFDISEEEDVIFAMYVGHPLELYSVGSNDPQGGDQWYLDATRAREAWYLSTGRDRTVTLLDTAIDRDHEDLADSLLEPIYVADQPTEHEHGTAIAGIIAGVRDNGVGIAGIAPHASILSIPKNYTEGSEGESPRVEVMNAAVESGIPKQVITISSGFDVGSVYADFCTAIDSFPSELKREFCLAKIGYDEDLQGVVIATEEQGRIYCRAIDRAHAAGHLVVVAAGNTPDDNDHWPGICENTLSVAAVGEDGQRQELSSYGAWVDIAAPGFEIRSTDVDHEYDDKFSGTSFASPMVASAAALLWSLHPELSHVQVRERLLAAARPDPALKIGGGHLDIFEALFNGDFEYVSDHWSMQGDTSIVDTWDAFTPPSGDKMMRIASGSITQQFAVESGIDLIPLNFRHAHSGEGEITITFRDQSGHATYLKSFTPPQEEWSAFSTAVPVSSAGMHSLEISFVGEGTLLMDAINFKGATKKIFNDTTAYQRSNFAGITDIIEIVELHTQMYVIVSTSTEIKLYTLEGLDVPPILIETGERPRDLVAYDDRLYWTAQDVEGVRHIYTMDNTGASAQLCATGGNCPAHVNQFFVIGDSLIAITGTIGIDEQMYVLDANGVFQSVTFDDMSISGYEESHFIQIDDRIYFKTFRNIPGQGQVYYTDDDFATVEVIADTDTGSHIPAVSRLAEFDGELYYTYGNGLRRYGEGTSESLISYLGLGNAPTGIYTTDERFYFRTYPSGLTSWASGEENATTYSGLPYIHDALGRGDDLYLISGPLSGGTHTLQKISENSQPELLPDNNSKIKSLFERDGSIYFAAGKIYRIPPNSDIVEEGQAVSNAHIINHTQHTTYINIDGQVWSF